MENNKDKKKQVEVDPLTNDEFVPDHEFDGIKELANNPPFWLSLLFIATLIFAYIYLADYHYFKKSPSQAEEYALEMAGPEEPEVPGDAPKVASAAVASLDLSKPLMDDANLNVGKSIYMTNCKICHLAEGQGQTGPNLTDKYWIHGGSYEDIVRTVSYGVIEKGMLPWNNQISKKQIAQVSSYVLSLVGTNPPGGKGPEGKEYIPEN